VNYLLPKLARGIIARTTFLSCAVVLPESDLASSIGENNYPTASWILFDGLHLNAECLAAQVRGRFHDICGESASFGL